MNYKNGDKVVLKNCVVLETYQNKVVLSTPNGGRKTVNISDVEHQE